MKLDVEGPAVHRAARSLTVAGVRGDRRYWRLAEALRPLPDQVQIRARGVAHRFDLSDPTFGPWAYRGQYERFSRALLARIVQPGWTCLDVGANQGYYSLVLAALVGSSGRVLAVEPSHHFSRQLDELAERAPWVSVAHCALAAHDGTATLVHFEEARGQSHLAGPGAIPEGHRGEEVVVETLAHVLAEHHLARLDLVKIDVEGAETPVLASLVDLDRPPRAVLVEIWDRCADESTRQAVAALEARGLAPHLIGRVQGGLRNRPGVRAIRVDEVGRGAEGNLLLVAPGSVPTIDPGQTLLPDA